MALGEAKLANRYAKALLRAVRSANNEASLPGIAEQLKEFVTAWQQHKTFADSILNPMFAEEQRAQAIAAILRQAGADEQLVRFVALVFERDRIAIMPQIAESFSNLADEYSQIVRVRVTTARELETQEKQELENTLAKGIGGKADFAWNVDASIIGGMIAEYSGKILDGSLRGQLARIEQSMNL